MNIEQRIIALGVILVSFIRYAHSDDEDCPSSPCCENKPKLGPDDHLELGLYFEQPEEGSQATSDLSESICKLVETCGEPISMMSFPGALIKEENGEMICPENYCAGDREQVCAALINPEHGTSCIIGTTMEAVEACEITNHDEVYRILIENGKNRENLGIPECKVPAVTFNGIFDLCANVSSYDHLLNYVCEMYENQLNCCNN